jgi:hypothetical protein
MSRSTIWKTVVVVFFLGPCLFGFGAKFYELTKVFQGDAEGAFAVAPMVNYLLATTGFLLLLGWATANGMFRNIEQPKYDMLAHEAELDRQAGK